MDRVGRYQILGELGRGAMGVVYKAQDPSIGRTVAIKTVRLSDFTDPKERTRLRDRLFREAQSAGILSHPGIVTIYDIQEAGETAFIFMEYVNGPTLDTFLSSPEPPSSETIFSILRQTAAALDYAHEKGIVHRDIKPANIMIRDDGGVKITDFGVAKITSQQMTQSGAMMGTPSYMSPEQIQGAPLDGRSDEFSLAVIVYELFTGEKPFSAESLPSLLFKIVREEPAAPQRLNPTLGPRIEAALRQALAKVPEQRYPTCTAFVQALSEACRATPGWKSIPRGASQNMPTVAGSGVIPAPPKAPDVPAPVKPAAETPAKLPVALPPLHRRAPRLDEERQPKRRKRVSMAPFIAMLLAALAVSGVFVAVTRGWIPSLPWLTPENKPAEEQPSTPAPAPAESGAEGQKPSPAGPPSTQPVPAATTPPAAAPPAVNEPAPAPEEKPAETRAPEEQEKPAPEPPEKAKPKRRSIPLVEHRAPAEVEVNLNTSPPGAQVVFDDDPARTCNSPCSMPLAAGRHTATATFPGYRPGLRVFEAPSERSLFLMLSKPSGSLAIKSNPAGATIFVNGFRRTEKTPALIELPPGRYQLILTIEGHPRSEQYVTVKDGVISDIDVDWGG